MNPDLGSLQAWELVALLNKLAANPTNYTPEEAGRILAEGLRRKKLKGPTA